MITRDRLKHLYIRGAALLWKEQRLLRHIKRNRLAVVLNLHRISAERNPYYDPLDPRLFEELLTYLKERFRLTTFRDCRAGAPADLPQAILSFDDGFLDFMDQALPLLQKHHVPANLNVIPSCVVGGDPPWTIALSDFLNAAPPRLLAEIQLPGFRHRLAGDSDEAKMRYGIALSNFLKMRPRKEREPLWQQLEVDMARVDTFEPTRMMSAAHVREAARTIEIGVHSYSHESMGFETMSFFEDDLERCAVFFRTVLQLPLDIYAFPNGSYLPAQVERLRQHETIKSVLLVGERFARPGGPIYPRFTIGASGAPELRLQALGYKGTSLL